MSNKPEFKSFNEFWPYYLNEHRQPISRILHYFGTTTSNFLLIYLVWQQYWPWLPVILAIGYGPAWIGHFFIEKNRPATFKHPIWSLMGDYKMLYFAITGKLSNEMIYVTPHQKNE